MRLEELMEILKAICEEKEEILPTQRLREDLCMTSFSFMMLMVRLESVLSCTLEPEFLIGVETVQELYEKICEKEKGK